jgi:hypothetical protein
MLRVTVEALAIVIVQPNSIVRQAEDSANPGQATTASLPRVSTWLATGFDITNWSCSGCGTSDATAS